ncbi:hypothetical protein ACM75Z_30600 [Pseudomonas aeruginosa]
MAAYPPGTIFETPMTFSSGDTFGEGCVFQPGSVFPSPCIFEQGCVFGEFCVFYKSDPRSPPSVTGPACVFAQGCSIDWVIIGEANVIGLPAQFNPVSVGPDTIIGEINNTSEGGGSHIESSCSGTTVVDGAGSFSTTDWREASNPTGVMGDIKVEDPSRCIP